MASKVATAHDASHRELREMPTPRMAKADLPKRENGGFQAEIGRAIVLARMMCGWSQKELAGKVDRDHRQVGRWETGEENPNLHLLMAIEELRQPLCEALSRVSGADVHTHIEFRKAVNQ